MDPEQYMPLHFKGSYSPEDSGDFLSWLLTSDVPETLVRCQLLLCTLRCISFGSLPLTLLLAVCNSEA